MKASATRDGSLFGDRRELHKAFWTGAPMARPLLALNIGLFGSDRCPETMKALPKGRIEPDDIPLGAFLEDCGRAFALHEQVDDDFPFVASPFVHVPWMEAIMGCPVAASAESIWAEPCVQDVTAWNPQGDFLENPWARKLLEILRALVREYSGRRLVSITMMRGPADIMAAMLGSADLPLALLDRPREARAMAEACGDAFIAVGTAQQEILPGSAEGFMDGDRGFRVWAPDRMIWLQEDAMALLSPALYRDFILPVDWRIAAQFPAVAFHLHPSALWAAAELAPVPEIDVVEMGFEDSVPDLEGTIEACRLIQRRKPLVVWKAYDSAFGSWLERVRSELSPTRGQGLSLQVTARNLGEATVAAAEFTRRTGGRT